MPSVSKNFVLGNPEHNLDLLTNLCERSQKQVPLLPNSERLFQKARPITAVEALWAQYKWKAFLLFSTAAFMGVARYAGMLSCKTWDDKACDHSQLVKAFCNEYIGRFDSGAENCYENDLPYRIKAVIYNGGVWLTDYALPIAVAGVAYRLWLGKSFFDKKFEEHRTAKKELFDSLYQCLDQVGELIRTRRVAAQDEAGKARCKGQEEKLLRSLPIAESYLTSFQAVLSQDERSQLIGRVRKAVEE